MRADRDNAIRYLGSWLLAVAAVWALLMAYGREEPWIDRFIIGEIAVCGAIGVYFIVRYSPKFTTRVIGVTSLFAGIVVLYVAAQILATGYWGEPIRQADPPPGVGVVPYWWRSLGRSFLAVAGPCILWGYYHWWHYEAQEP